MTVFLFWLGSTSVTLLSYLLGIGKLLLNLPNVFGRLF